VGCSTGWRNWLDHPVASAATILASCAVGFGRIYIGLISPLARLAIATLGTVAVVDGYKYPDLDTWLTKYETHYSAAIAGVAGLIGGPAVTLSEVLWLL
jgi:hypothetical protein